MIWYFYFCFTIYAHMIYFRCWESVALNPKWSICLFFLCVSLPMWSTWSRKHVNLTLHRRNQASVIVFMCTLWYAYRQALSGSGRCIQKSRQSCDAACSGWGELSQNVTWNVLWNMIHSLNIPLHTSFLFVFFFCCSLLFFCHPTLSPFFYFFCVFF